MGMNYQPQMATSQMSNTALSSGMAAGAQIKATAMNNASAENRNFAVINSQQMMERNRLRQAGQQFNLTHQLGMDRLDMERGGQLFGQQKDVATFNENKRAADFREEMELMKFAKPDVDKTAADEKERLGADAEWDVIDTELDSVMKGLDPVKDAGRIASMTSWRSKLAGWRKAPNSLSYLRAFQKSRTSNPMFGTINTQTTETPSTGMSRP
jgi:hypothetical protein